MGLVPNAGERVKPPSPLYSFLKHLKENVELTFHHCQIMVAEYCYFSHCELPCGRAASSTLCKLLLQNADNGNTSMSRIQELFSSANYERIDPAIIAVHL